MIKTDLTVTSLMTGTKSPNPVTRFGQTFSTTCLFVNLSQYESSPSSNAILIARSGTENIRSRGGITRDEYSEVGREVERERMSGRSAEEEVEGEEPGDDEEEAEENSNVWRRDGRIL
jgi:hypothetical protein